MKSVREWSIKSTVDASQYWQGAGLAGTTWDTCCTGVEGTEREALESALDGLVQDDYEIPSDLQAEVAKVSERTVCDAIDCEHARLSRDYGDAICGEKLMISTCMDCEWHWFVTVFVK